MKWKVLFTLLALENKLFTIKYSIKHFQLLLVSKYMSIWSLTLFIEGRRLERLRLLSSLIDLVKIKTKLIGVWIKPIRIKVYILFKIIL